MQKEVVERLFDLFAQSGATELEYRSGTDALTLSRAPGAAGAAPATVAAVPAAVAATPAAPGTGATARPADGQPPPADASGASGLSGAQVQQASLTGNFYRRRAPDAPVYAEVGDVVAEGQVLGLIETMKLLNEVEAEQAGRLVRFHAENGKPVKAGEPLVEIEPLESAGV